MTETTRTLRALYWGTTGVAALALGGIAAADLLRAPAILAGLGHLGYPAYFATIIGLWKLAGVVAILAPGLSRLKEWACAGFFFTLTGAAASHAIIGDPIGQVLFPVVLLGLVMASRALSPAREARVTRPLGAALAA